MLIFTLSLSLSLYIYIYICVCVCVCAFIYLHIYIFTLILFSLIGYIMPNSIIHTHTHTHTHIYIYIYIFIIQCVKACAIPCPHQPSTRGDNTVSIAQGGTATPGSSKQLLPLDRVFKRTIYIYIYVFNQRFQNEYFIYNILDKQDIICLQRIKWFQFIIFFGTILTFSRRIEHLSFWHFQIDWSDYFPGKIAFWWEWSRASCKYTCTNQKSFYKQNIVYLNLLASTFWLVANLDQVHSNGSQDIQNIWRFSVHYLYADVKSKYLFKYLAHSQFHNKTFLWLEWHVNTLKVHQILTFPFSQICNFKLKVFT